MNDHPGPHSPDSSTVRTSGVGGLHTQSPGGVPCDCERQHLRCTRNLSPSFSTDGILERFERMPKAVQAALVGLGEVLTLTNTAERRVLAAQAEVIGLSSMPPALVRAGKAIGAVVDAANRTAYGPSVADVLKKGALRG